MYFQNMASSTKIYAIISYHGSVIQKFSAEFAIPIKIASIAAGSTFGGLAGMWIGSIAGRATPIFGETVGKTIGKYIGTTLGGLTGEIVGDKLVEVIMPVVLGVAEPGYIRVDVQEKCHPPKFFERVIDL
jgi:membrane protein YqaA with SNARE-associated domain